MSKLPELISELKIERYLYKSKCLKQKKVIDRLSRKIQRKNTIINKAINFIENHIIATETEDILLNILKGANNDKN